MIIPKKDLRKMKSLVKEGKQITKIVSEDFPQYDYWDILYQLYEAGAQSAQGVKWMITNRLNQLLNADAQTRKSIINEINDLTWCLYENYKDNQKKLENIRDVLGE